MEKHVARTRYLHHIVSRRTAIVTGIGAVMGGVAAFSNGGTHVHADPTPPFTSVWHDWAQLDNPPLTYGDMTYTSIPSTPAVCYSGPGPDINNSTLNIYIQIPANTQAGKSGTIANITSSAGAWGQWQTLGTLPNGNSFASYPVAATGNADSEVYVFALGSDKSIWQLHSQSGGHTWSSLKGSFTGSFIGAPAAASWGAGHIEVCARADDNHIWHNWSTDGGNTWAAWEDMGGPYNSDPAMISKGVNHVEIFALGSDQAMWHNWWEGSAWSGWSTLGGSFLSGPAASSWGPNRIDLCAQSIDKTCWHAWWDGGASWKGWETLGGTLTGTPALASPQGSNRLDVYALGTDQKIWRKWLG